MYVKLCFLVLLIGERHKKRTINSGDSYKVRRNHEWQPETGSGA